LLAVVTSDNDYAFASSDLNYGNLLLRKNNFAQRNLSVIDVLSSPTSSIIVSFGVQFQYDNLDRFPLPGIGFFWEETACKISDQNTLKISAEFPGSDG